MDGPFISRYPNGKLKSEGFFLNNQRNGNWKVYDSAGIVFQERFYLDNFRFKFLTLNGQKADKTTTSSIEKYTLKRSAEGFYIYPEVKELEVAASKRLWRILPVMAGNELIYKDNRLFDIMFKNILAGNLKAYDASSDEFEGTLTTEQVYNTSLAGKCKIVHFKIKEEWFYSNKRLMSETRILGICPVIESDNEPKDIFWIYYPEFRAILAAEKVMASPLSVQIENLDDVFFFRDFSSLITKEYGLRASTKNVDSSPEYLESETKRIEATLIEIENNLWLDHN